MTAGVKRPPGLLDGVRVLDFSRLVPGPFATLVMADLGADVVKVEDPGLGDYLRFLPPMTGGHGAAFGYLNRGKRGLKLDLKDERGRELARRLAARADVLIEGFRPGVMESLSMGWEDLRADNPRLVYCSISGYGREGPMARRAGHDLNYIALAGLLGLGGEPSGSPVPPGTQIADLAGGGLWAVVAILAALRHAERTGEGQHLDVSMTAGTQALLGFHGAESLATSRSVRRGDSVFSGYHPAFSTYRCADGEHLAVAALEPKFWRPFSAALGIDGVPDAMGLPREEWPALRARIGAVLATRPRAEWLAELEPHDCCVEPVLDVCEAFDHPQSQAHGMVVEVDCDGADPVRQPGFPVKFSATPACAGGPAPAPGEHERQVLSDWGVE